MRSSRYLLLPLLLSGIIRAQVPEPAVRGLEPAARPVAESPRVHAVVIGISDYQDPAIPDRPSARRDAEAFAEGLRAPAGGSVQEEHLKLLLNEQATAGGSIAAMDWLIASSRPGDEALIFFSGRGDAARDAQPLHGYWLCWDSPATPHAAGDFPLRFLQAVVTALSENKVRVKVVADAVRTTGTAAQADRPPPAGPAPKEAGADHPDTLLEKTMTRDSAAALIDKGQQGFNLLLRTDPRVVDLLYARGQFNYEEFYGYFSRAAELLGQGHYAYATLKAKAHFFEVRKRRARNDYYTQADDPAIRAIRQTLEEGLRYEANAPYLLFSLVDFPTGLFLSADSLRRLGERLDSLCPDWAMAHYALGATFFSKFWRRDIGSDGLRYAADRFRMACHLDSAFLAPLKELAWVYECLGEHQQAGSSRLQLVRKTRERMERNPDEVYAFDYQALGNALWRLRRYQEALDALRQAAARPEPDRAEPARPLLTRVYTDLGRYEEALRQRWVPANWKIYAYFLEDDQTAEKELGRFPPSVDQGLFLFQRGRLEEAQRILEAVLVDHPDDPEALFWSGEVLRARNQPDSAAACYRRFLAWDAYDYLMHARRMRLQTLRLITLHRLRGQQELRQERAQFRKNYGDDPGLYFQLACFHAMTGATRRALRALSTAEKSGWQPRSALDITNTAKDPLLDPVRHLPEFISWEKRWSPPYRDYSGQ